MEFLLDNLRSELQSSFNPEFVKVINREIEVSENIPPISTLLSWMQTEEVSKADMMRE